MTQQIDIVANLLVKVDNAEAGINRLKNSLSKLKIPDGLENGFKKSFANLDVIFARYRSQVEKGFSTKADVTNFSKTGKALDAELDRISKYFTELTGKPIDFKVNSAEITKTEQELTKLIAQRNELAKNSIKFEISGAKEGYKDIESLLTKLKEATGNTKTSQYASGALDFLKQGDLQSALALLDKASVSCKRFSDEKQKAFASDTGFNMSTAVKKIIDELTGAEGKFGNVNAEVAKFEQILADLRTGQIKDAGDLAQRLADDMLNAGTAAKQANGAMQDFAQSSFFMNQQLGQLQQSTQYFFGLRNMINLLKRGLKEALSTIKELDAAMTETAVVTKFNVSDMWAKLPEYTANANALGATVLDMYKSTTLYYQQGLNTEQAMGIAAETMKMARIAGLEAADATDKMTAALRGFNMEINEASAQRINDVYSNLAAKTASNVEELGSAMQRTASIAANAGMSFEGTAAFLAQAIETTREPAENIGTAMKTIIARMQEMKKNPLEIGEVEGEEVSYNKIDAALQSVGISLKKANGDFRDNDEVLLDISRTWDSLTQTQQRYIATTIAGSRQQSRFIAMVSDYDRTMQLMDYANNAEGASNEQFGKTLDSLEAKLNKFQNAWQKFLMGIMNDSWTKGIVSGATKILDVVNKITDLLSGGGKLKGVKSMLSLFTAFTALKMAGRGINGLIGGLGGMLDPKVGFKGGFSTGILGGQATKISNPNIDRAAGIGPKNQAYGNFSGAKQDLAKALLSNKTSLGVELNSDIGKYSLSGIQQIFDKNQINNAAQQKALFASFPGLKKNMTSALASLMKESSENPEVTKGLMAGFRQGKYTSEEVLQKSGLLTNFSQAVEERTKEGGEKAGKAFVEAQRRTIDKETYKAIRSQGRKEGYTGEELETYTTKQIDDKLNQRGAVYAKTQKIDDALHAERQLPVYQKWANSIGQVGGALTSAGMSLQMLGSQLSMTNPLLGEMVTKMGSLLTVAGSIPNMISSLVAGGPMVWAIAGGIAAIGTAIAVANNQIKKIQDSAAKVSKNFQETNQTTQKNIDSLKSYQGEFARLVKGVDSNGNNINLSDSDYTRYLEIVDEIAAMNPEIVEGYNAQGHAIITNNEALEKTLKLEQDLQKEALNRYQSEASLEKLLAARNLPGSDYSKYAGFGVNDKTELSEKEKAQLQKSWGSTEEGLKHIRGTHKEVAPMRSQVKKVAQELKDSDIFKQNEQDVRNILDTYGIDFDALLDGEKNAVDNFVKNQSSIQSKLSGAAERLGLDFADSFNESFSKLGEDTEAFDASIQPVYDYLVSRFSSSNFYQDLAPEMKSAVMSGLKDLAGQDLTANDMIKESNIMAAKFEALSRKGGEYSTIMDQVTEAQANFVNTLDSSQYQIDIAQPLQKLEQLRKEALSEETAYGNALAEYYENLMAKISSYTSETSVTLSEALNSMSSQLAAAEETLNAFSESTKKDYDTAANGFKDIYDTVFKETEVNGVKRYFNTEGNGSNTMWEGAKALLGQDFIESVGGDPKKVEAQMKKWGSSLEEGADGWYNFLDEVKKIQNESDGELAKAFQFNEDGTFELHLETDEEFAQLAQDLGISEELLISMLNKGRQFADISFTNVKGAREALAVSESTIKGTSAKKGDQQTIYVKEESIRQELWDNGYKTIEAQNAEISRLFTEGNISVIPADKNDWGQAEFSKSFTDTFKDWGVDDTADLIETLVKTGEFNKDEIKDIAEQASDLGLLEDYNAEEYDDTYADTVKDIENPQLSEQTSELQNLNSTAKAILTAVGTTPSSREKALTDAQDKMHGKNGTDTAMEWFAQGKNEEGKWLSPKEFETQKELAQDTAETYTATAEMYKEMAELTGDESYAELAEGYSALADEALDYIEQAEKAFDEHRGKLEHIEEQNTEQQKYQSFRLGEIGKYIIDEYLPKNGFGNTNIYDRPTIDWGNKPSQNPNFKAAQTYGWTAADLRGTTSTYMSTADNFNTLNGGEISVAFTPVMENGEVVNSETMHNYIDALITEATDTETGKLDLSKLMELDQEGLEGFATESGEKIHNALMGAFEGENKEEYAGALGEAEHYLSSIDGLLDTITPKSAILKENLAAAPNYEPYDPKATEEASDTEIEQTVTMNMELSPQFTETYNWLQQNSQDNLFIDIAFKLVDGGIGIADWIAGLKEDVESDPINIEPNLDPTNVETGAQAAKDAVDGIPDTKNVTLTVTDAISGTLGSVSSKLSSIAAKAASIVVGHGATGINNTIRVSTLPTFQSAAKGIVGPKNKGGLTLTGEKGFEIAWLPGESRSMILGADGPQMVNLPADAVVYTHEQSKDILKRKAIPAGSHAVEGKGGTTNPYSGGSGGDTPAAPLKTSAKKLNQAADDTSDAAENTDKAADAIQDVCVWWENIARRAEQTQRLIDENQKTYEKYLKSLKATLKTTGTIGQGNQYISNLNKSKKINKKQIDRANSELNRLNNGKAAKTQEGRQAQWEKGAPFIEKISYKSGDDTKTAFADLSAYIKQLKDGTYIVDQKALNQIANRDQRKATADAANKAIDDRLLKLNKAQDEFNKAQKQLEEFSNQLYETFFAWETSLTKIWNITQKIDEATAKLERADVARNLLDVQIASGLRKADSSTLQQELKSFQDRLQQQNDVVKKREEAITQAQKDVRNAAGKNDEQAQINLIEAQLKADKKVKADLENKALEKEKRALQKKKTLSRADKKRLRAINTQIKKNNTTIGSAQDLSDAQKLVGKKGLNTTQLTGLKEARKQLNKQKAIIDKAQSFMTTTRNADGTVSIDFDYDKFNAEKMKGNINEETAKAIEDYVNGIKDANDSLNDLIDNLGNDLIEYYQSLEDLNKQWADYEDQLIKISEESNKKELDNLKKLSDSIKQAMDDLLKDVKKKLEERRRQEDNRKTEQDISRKQQRLSALRADTSGGHQVEIAQLEKEIADAQENYQRSLEDQLLNKLQEQADVAAAQRERQIKLQEEILTSTNNIAEVKMWMANPEQFHDEILAAYREANDYEKHGAAGQAEIDTEFETFFKGLTTNREEAANLTVAIQNLEDTIENFETLSNQVGLNVANAKEQGLTVTQAHEQISNTTYKELREKGGYTAKDFAEAGISYQVARNAGFKAADLMQQDKYKNEATTEITKAYQDFLTARGSKKSKDKNKGKLTKSDYSAQLARGQALGYSEKKVAANLATTDMLTWKQVLKAAKAYGTKGKIVKQWYPNAKKTGSFYKAFESVYGKWSKFATGGLATSTGPAWLDGTPSRPELVLNSTDTKNFLMLKDVLASAMKGMGDTSNTYGDIMYEININVDKIEKDYDVDRVVEKVKKEITKGAGYRNVTQVRNLR